MIANILNEKELTAGTVVTKGSYYYIVMTWNELIGGENNNLSNQEIKKRKKWLPTKISVKESGGKKKAKDLLLLVRVTFDKENPDIPINKLLAQDKEPQEISEKEGSPQTVTVEDKGILFSDYIIEWVEDIKSRVELPTYASYRRNVHQKIAPYFKKMNIYLSELTAQDIHLFYKSLRKKGLKAKTVIRSHSNIRKSIADAMEFNNIYKVQSSVLLELKKPHKPDKEIFIPNFYTVEEVNDLFSAVQGSKIDLITRLTAFYGFRREEVLGLKWSAINFNQNTISISHTVTQCTIDGKFMLVFKDRAKNPSSRRTLPLVAELRDILLAHKEKIEDNKKIFGKSYNSEYMDYVCVNINGNLKLDLLLPNDEELEKLFFEFLKTKFVNKTS